MSDHHKFLQNYFSTLHTPAAFYTICIRSLKYIFVKYIQIRMNHCTLFYYAILLFIHSFLYQKTPLKRK